MLFSKIIRKKFDAVLGRYDGNPACYYYSAKDFPDINRESFDVLNDKGEKLKGYFYSYGETDPAKLVVFDHGIGAGHLAYFCEIETLCKRGYTVYSYDHTGCVDSGGTGIYGFAQGISDLDRVLNAIKADRRFAGETVRLVGHSWGGYSAMNAAALHGEVTHVVSLAGFLSARALIEQYLPKFVLKYSDEVMDRERENNPEYADMDARDSLQKTSAKLLYFQSKDDDMVTYDRAFLPLQEALKGRANTQLVSLSGKRHEPQHSDRSVAVYAEFKEKLNTLVKKKKLLTKEAQDSFRKAQDWKTMVEQDKDIWNRIFAFLES